jgi:aminomethyltransferase
MLGKDDLETYHNIRSARAGFCEQRRGLIEVRGKEAVQFLDGMVTNDIKTLEEGAQMMAAFPNAQGRLLAVVRVLRDGDRLLIETEDATREKLYQNLFRFTFAGDFFVEELSEEFAYFKVFGPINDVYNPAVGEKFEGALAFEARHGASYFVPAAARERFVSFLSDENGCVPIDEDLYEVLRVEAGIPKFGVDMDETTIVPELGLEGMISYTKGCYIGQEIIARIHFRGHVAKRLTGVMFEDGEAQGVSAGGELISTDGKNAGRVTSVVYSPKLNKTIGLAFVRYDYLAEGTPLTADGLYAHVKDLPIVS